MNYKPFQTKVTKLLFCCAVFGIFFSAFVSTTKAQATSTFAQFSQRTGANSFRFTNNTPTASGTFDTVLTTGVPINFQYFDDQIDQTNNTLNPSLIGFQNAHLFVSTTTTATVATNGSNLTQPLNQTVVISIIRDTPAPAGSGIGARTNLLTATISTGMVAPPAITGVSGGNTANFSPTTPDQTVIFTSDFLSFSTTTDRNLGFSFSSVTPQIGVGANTILQSFTAAGTGTFASNPKPVPFASPTAAPVTIGGRVLTPSGRGLIGAHVNLTGADGTTRTVITNSFGYYRFSNLTAGETAILSVDSKRYYFATQVVTVTEDTNNLNFLSEK